MFRAVTCIVTLGLLGGFSPAEVQLRKTLGKKLKSVPSPSCPNDRDLLVDCLNGDFNKKFDSEKRDLRFKNRNKESDLPVVNDNYLSRREPNEKFEDSIEELDLRGLGLSGLSENELKSLLSLITKIETMAILDLRGNGFDYNDNFSTVSTLMAESDFISETPGRWYSLRTIEKQKRSPTPPQGK
jgi:hypothetical protein